MKLKKAIKIIEEHEDEFAKYSLNYADGKKLCKALDRVLKECKKINLGKLEKVYIDVPNKPIHTFEEAKKAVEREPSSSEGGDGTVYSASDNAKPPKITIKGYDKTFSSIQDALNFIDENKGSHD